MPQSNKSYYRSPFLPFGSFLSSQSAASRPHDSIQPMLKNKTFVLGSFTSAISLLPVSRRGLLISCRRCISTTPITMAPPKPAQDFLDFVNASPTRKSHPRTTNVKPHSIAHTSPAYHAVASSVKLLEAAGFKGIKERDNWSSDLQPGGKYYLTRNGSSIVAFAIGKKWAPGSSIAMIGAHTDSPCLRIKPVSKKTNAGFLQVGVETYGGGIWHSWFDRDLSVAGRVLVKDSGGNFVQKLIKVDKPILRIPTLAIHLDRSANFDPNKETELFPICGLAAAELNRTGVSEKEAKKEEAPETEGDGEFQPLKAMTQRHHPYLLEIIAQHAGVETDGVVDFELVLYDTQKSCFGGLNDEFIFSPRLDNLGMTYCSVLGLIESVKSDSALDSESSIRLITCFDHEEIGSTSAHGANSNLLPAVLRRLSVLPRGNFFESGSEKSYEHINPDDIATAFEQTLSTSFFVSADMAHSGRSRLSSRCLKTLTHTQQ